MSTPVIYFPINQREQAAQDVADSLLARAVYEKLAETLDSALQTIRQLDTKGRNDDNVDSHRTHNAVLIDGSRGTGKSSVLVNLPLYLKKNNREVYENVHIIKPVDPTLLDHTDDLFLNVIVAALISDRSVKQTLEKGGAKADEFHRQLQKLGNAMESLQSQRDLQGMDKLRAFIGNQSLAQQVHLLFKCTLDLLDKKLLVLPIDDVDTSLDRAFDNLEVVRKYLVSPQVLPIISGDLTLYNDVTWRDFHGKLLEKSKFERSDAMARAKDLAQEYQRKVLPLQYRVNMPEVADYLNASDIYFKDEHGNNIGKISMALFYGWLVVLLNERTNGVESSFLKPPVENVRALAQIVFSLRTQIPNLAKEVENYKVDSLQLRRMLIMPTVANAMQQFSDEYSSAMQSRNKSRRETARGAAYLNFKQAAESPSRTNNENGLNKVAEESKKALLKYYQFEPKAGAAFLVLTAEESWRALRERVQDADWRSVFETFLFKPLTHDAQSLRHFEPSSNVNKLQMDDLLERAPAERFANFSSRILVAYPTPEVGHAVKNSKAKFQDPDLNLLMALILHRDFYTINKQAALACCGRIFEILITSLIRDMDYEDIVNILQHTPFFSFSSVATTTTQTAGGFNPTTALSTNFSDESDENAYSEQIEVLTKKINEWRNEHNLKDKIPSAWLIYNVMNKFFHQAWFFNAPKLVNAPPTAKRLEYIVAVAPKIFNSIWAAFANFEKGPVFGMPLVIAQVKIGDGKSFENSDLYRQNIAPFVSSTTGAENFGKNTGAFTYILNNHPLKLLVEKMTGDIDTSEPDSLLDFLNEALGTSYTNFQAKRLFDKLQSQEHSIFSEIVHDLRDRFTEDPEYWKIARYLEDLPDAPSEV
jgi:hypothetical protein